MSSIFDADQKKALESLNKGKNILVSGPGGSGKSTLISHVVKIFLDQKKNIGITATTGNAAILIGGRTLHSFLGIGLGDQPAFELADKVRKNTKIVRRWKNLDLLIMDEVSMLNPRLFETLNLLGKLLRENNEPFGGIQLLLSGDFYQLPVVKCSDFVFEATCWEECIDEVILLTKVKRQKDEIFLGILNRLRVGDGIDDDFQFLKELEKKKEEDLEILPTKLFCKNADVDFINEKELMKIDTDEIYRFDLEVSVPEGKTLPANFDPTKYCNAQSILRLCVGAQVLLLYNVDPNEGLVNGSRGTVIKFDNDLPLVKFLNGVERYIDYNIWEVKEDKKVIAKISQIPLRLAYAITIHKSQGMTLESAIIDLDGVFEFGQAYVALSRIKSTKNLIVRNATKRSFRVHPKAKRFYECLCYSD